jgi:hypothetical protein
MNIRRKQLRVFHLGLMERGSWSWTSLMLAVSSQLNLHSVSGNEISIMKNTPMIIKDRLLNLTTPLQNLPFDSLSFAKHCLDLIP